MTTKTILIALLLVGFVAGAQEKDANPVSLSNWYDKLKVNGYMQLRYNDLYKTNPDMENPQGDRTYGGYDGFSIRRMRLKVSGQVHPRLYFYFQADFASDGKNLGQLRDAYFDYFLDPAGEWRMRGGQSKIPFGFENLQSSQDRLALDRNDPLNSAVRDERDMGIGIHYAPQAIRERFKTLKSKGLKGSGDYGMAYVMVYNGQRGNSLVPDEKKIPHIAARFTYPIELSSGQYMEFGVQGYTGNYKMTSVTDGVVVRNDDGSLSSESAMDKTFADQRIAGTIVYYPQPFGFQAEYNFGVGPEFAYDAVNEIGSVGKEKLHGGYAQVMYRIQHNKQEIFPFVKGMYYDGGKKFELDARSYTVKELEIGVEWQPIKAFEAVAMYTISDRRYEDMANPVNRQAGQLIRIQLQVNF
ncbi:porin [Carboxylicivirga sediminis]|uniref:Porin n=1 Tax=Carboxylicivirga sediminis TaxID=2006564 RepID=A0A941F3J2_9BACT|nr:porin [Carboxylicivirga sediminis]MBR8536121.1 porin [Carboxylicivirga sediminis]